MVKSRVKTVLWLAIFKAYQYEPAMASTRSALMGDETTSSFTRLGRISFAARASRNNDYQSSSSSTTTIDARRRNTKLFSGIVPSTPTTTTSATAASMTTMETSVDRMQYQTMTADERRQHRYDNMVRHVSLRRPRPFAATATTTTTTIEEPAVDELQNKKERGLTLALPIIPVDAWEASMGDEWEDEEVVDSLVKAGLELCWTAEKPNEWIDWKAHKDTEKILQQKHPLVAMDDGDVLVYVGKAKKEGYADHLPIIMTKSVLPLSAHDMADLLMDSTKVQIYNKLSVGRTDIKTLSPTTKIVCNLTKPPVSKSKMVSVTMMHSCKVEGTGGDRDGDSYLVISRAVPGMVDDALKDLPRNDILLGVNLLEDCGPNECRMTCMTHVYSPALPTMLAKTMGVSSAMNFVKDIRKACGQKEPVPVAM